MCVCVVLDTEEMRRKVILGCFRETGWGEDKPTN